MVANASFVDDVRAKRVNVLNGNQPVFDLCDGAEACHVWATEERQRLWRRREEGFRCEPIPFADLKIDIRVELVRTEARWSRAGIPAVSLRSWNQELSIRQLHVQ